MANWFGVYELLAKSGLFDPDYYVRANPDIANLNIDPLTHYLESGATELRNPSEAFDARYYAQLCHARGERVDNPLLHYIEVGAGLGLTPRPQEPSVARASAGNGAQVRPTSASASAQAPQLLLGLDRIGIESSRGVERLTGAGWCLAAQPIVNLRVALGAIAVQARYGLPRTDVALTFHQHHKADQSGFDFALEPIPEERALNAELIFTAVTDAGETIQRSQPVDLEALRAAAATPSPYRVNSNIQHFCDRIEITTDGRVAIMGWAIAAAATDRILVLLDGTEIGLAEIGIERPDVGNQFRTLAHARRAGFSFQHGVPGVSAGEHLITLRHRANGEETDILLPVLGLTVGAPDEEPDTPLAQAQDLLLSIDLPKLVDGSVATPVRSNLEIAGWALARRGVASIDIAIDGVRIKSAHTGVRRPDVQRAHPDWEGALTAGFSALLPHRSLPKGTHVVSIALCDQAGETARSEIRIEVEDATDTDGPWSLRRRMSLAEIELRVRSLPEPTQRPSFAVVLTLTRDAGALQQARVTLASLATQVYDNWRLYILTPKRQPLSARRALLEGVDALSGRVVLISGAHAVGGLLAARGAASFLMVLRPGDELGCDALLEFAVHATEHPEADFLYCNERRLSPASGKVDAFFKPQWSPDLLLSMNYVGRAWCARAATFRRAAMRPNELTKLGSYDLALRLTEQATSIRHVPVTLLQAADFVAQGDSAERDALRAALERRGIAASVNAGRAHGTHRVRRTLRTRGLVSIIIPTRAARGLIRSCIETLRGVTAYRNVEIVCIENIPADKPDWKVWLRANADTVIETQEPFNWSRYNNLAAAAASGEYLLFLNDDIEITDRRWLHTLLEQAERPEVGAVGPQLLYPDGRVQHAGMFLASLGIARHAFRNSPQDDPGYFGLALAQRDVIAVTGACLLTRRETFESLGRFNESHDIVNNDIDYCLRVWKSGLRTIYTPHTKLIHHELASRSDIADSYDAKAFASKWRSIFTAGDPFFPIHLAKDRDDYSIEWEPVEALCAVHPVFARESIRRILIVKLDHIGDCVTALPAIRRLKRLFPSAKLVVLTSRASKAVWALEPAIDQLIEFDFFNARSSSGLIEQTEQDWRELRRRLAPLRFDLAIDLRKHWETRVVLRHTGARYLAGFDMKGRFPWLDVAIEWSEDVALIRKRQHTTDDLVNLVDAVAASGEPNDTRSVQASPALSAAARRLIPMAQRIFDKRVVCVHPSAGNEMKQWPLEYFGMLIDQLIEAEDIHVILIGTPDESDLGASILEAVTNAPSVWSLIGRVDLHDLPALIARCALFVGNDSGPKHIAAALGVPTVGIHSGVVDAREWGPRGTNAIAIHRAMTCAPCYRLTLEDCNRGLACLRGLLPEHVVLACHRLLASAAGRNHDGRRESRA